MNNLRLLTVLLAAILSGVPMCAYGNTVITSIEQLFNEAEVSSPQLKPFFTAQDEARREVSVARSGRLPDIEALASLSYIGDGFTTRRSFKDFQKAPIPHLGNGLSLSVTQPVYAGGAITAAIDMAELRSTAARYATDFRRDDIRFRLAGYYLDLYKFHNLRSVVVSNIASARKMLADMRARYEQGTVLLNDITRYELLVANLELQLTQINNTISILSNNLIITAGLPSDTKIEPDSTLLERTLPVGNGQWWIDEARQNSPSLKLAQTEVDINREAEKLVRAESLPKVGLQAGWNIDGPILTEVPPINRNLSYWFVGVGVSYNLSSLYKNNRSMARSRMATQRAAEQLVSETDNLTMAVQADHIKYLEAYDELTTRNKALDLAERNYRTVATRYSADMALITDLLDAADSRLDAERQLVNARINIIYYYYKLLFTSGKI